MYWPPLYYGSVMTSSIIIITHVLQSEASCTSIMSCQRRISMESNSYEICPYCSEEIKPDAIKCKHCKSILSEKQVDASVEPKKDNNINDQSNGAGESTIDKTEKYKPDDKRWDLASPDSNLVDSNNVSDVADKSKNHKNESHNEFARKKSPSDEHLKTPQESSAYYSPTYLEIYSFVAGISYFLSVIFIGLGFHKMFAYNNPDGRIGEAVNAYVGGDAYNYIINANYATAYFALAVFCAVIGMTAVLGYLAIKSGANHRVSSAKAE